MPETYPPVSAQRNSYHGSRRSRESSRDRQRVRQTQQRPLFDEKREKHDRLKRARTHAIAMSGEFLGTTMFLWLAFAGVQAAANVQPNVPMDVQRLLYISLCFGMSLLVVVWAFYRISGGLFNPAVTLGLVVTGAVPWFRGLLLLPAQLLGGIVAAALVQCMFPGPLVVVTTLAPGVSIAQGVFIEAFLTCVLVFVILMLAAEKHKATFIAPVGIGLALFICELAGVYYTGGSLNPSRSFGPSVVVPSFPHYHYIYWFGPIIGALMAGGYYSFVKRWGYEDANPGQDEEKE